MSKSKVLRGMAWDHPQARNPLEAISTEWSRSLDITVRWDASPLQDFEDQPLEDLATAYDLVLIDYSATQCLSTFGGLVDTYLGNWEQEDG